MAVPDEDGDAQYLRETGVAHLLHAASLQASRRSDASRSSRNVFAQLVSPGGDLQVPLPITQDVLLRAPKIHPALLVRFLNGTFDPDAMPTSRDAAELLRTSPMGSILERAAAVALHRSADVVMRSSEAAALSKQAGAQSSALPVFASATCDLASGLRALSSIVLANVRGATEAGAAAAVDGNASFASPVAVQVHVDVILQLRLDSFEPPSQALTVLQDAVSQLSWLLQHTKLEAGSSATACITDLPTFHLHVAVPPVGDGIGAVEHEALRNNLTVLVRRSTLASCVTVTGPALGDSLASVLEHQPDSATTSRLLALVGTDVRRFHLGNLGESIAACISGFSADGSTDPQAASSGSAKPSGALQSPKKKKAQAPKGQQGQSAAGDSAAAAGDAKKDGQRAAIVFVGVRREAQRSVTISAPELKIDRVATAWYSSRFRMLLLPTGTADADETTSEQGSSKAIAAELLTVPAVDVSDTPSVVLPLSALLGIAPSEGSPRARALAVLQSIFPHDVDHPQQVDGRSRGIPVQASGCVCVFADAIARTHAAAAQPLLVTSGWCPTAQRQRPQPKALALSLAVATWVARAAGGDPSAAGSPTDASAATGNSEGKTGAVLPGSATAFLTAPPSAAAWASA